MVALRASLVVRAIFPHFQDSKNNEISTFNATEKVTNAYDRSFSSSKERKRMNHLQSNGLGMQTQKRA